ncbi:hypothetical protein EYF80_029379 [Liparis tanakae]|uniref:Uncharacterized protein n=1 Tax=Liparis tanakae TaxID=230148 RepID=A0A4Z2H4K7_9TELE|nr:hypothetical protein EYF80_029379 [Liparis tanakae]
MYSNNVVCVWPEPENKTALYPGSCSSLTSCEKQNQTVSQKTQPVGESLGEAAAPSARSPSRCTRHPVTEQEVETARTPVTRSTSQQEDGWEQTASQGAANQPDIIRDNMTPGEPVKTIKTGFRSRSDVTAVGLLHIYSWSSTSTCWLAGEQQGRHILRCAFTAFVRLVTPSPPQMDDTFIH